MSIVLIVEIIYVFFVVQNFLFIKCNTFLLHTHTYLFNAFCKNGFYLRAFDPENLGSSKSNSCKNTPAIAPVTLLYNLFF